MILDRARLEAGVRGVLEFCKHEGHPISAADARQYLAGEDVVYRIYTLIDGLPVSQVMDVTAQIIRASVMIDGTLDDKLAYLSDNLPGNLNTAARDSVMRFFEWYY